MTRIKSNIKQVPWAVRRAVADGMEAAAKHLVRVTKANLNTPYPPASSPGDFPHRRTGNLRNAIDYWINRKTLSVYVGPNTDAPYAWHLERGTSRMAARPFLAPSYGQIKASMKRRIADATKSAMRKYMKK